MSKRISIKEIEPEAYKAMMALENYVKSIGLDPKLKELIKIRASQMNGCDYCIDMHTEMAIKAGENEARISSLSAWKESDSFSEEEKIALQLTEEMTFISNGGVTDVTYDRAVSFFGGKVTAQLIMVIVLINSWNRIMVTTKEVYK